MKKIAILFSVILLSTTVYGQFGIKAGLNFNSMKDFNVNELRSSFEGKTGFHVGVLYKLNLPLGFALQPELMYTQKGGSIDMGGRASGDIKMNYLQLPVNLQWGVDLVLFRPFVMVSPYIGYAIAKGDGFKDVEWDNLNKFEYGVGIGAGLDIWKFQVSGRYCWDLGTISDFKGDSFGEGFEDVFRAMNNGKNRGFELSIAFLF